MVDTSSRTRFGTANPEHVENALWQSSIAQYWTAARLRESIGAGLPRLQVFSHSDYRDATPGPFWSWQRFGRSSTPLLDGRIIHVAGGHEDASDSDFCIYNDVVVEHPDGRTEIFLYPKDVFPPTDYHSATLVGRTIILIGSLGYADLRKPSETQVLKLDTETLHIEPVTTTGEKPGWLARHTSTQISDEVIRIAGGKVQTPEGIRANAAVFTLDLATTTWRRAEHSTAATNPLERPELKAVEIELALIDEKFPIGLDSLRLIRFFERNAAGNWTCIRTIPIAGPDGEALLIRPRQTFSRGMSLAGIDFYEHLQWLAWRADRG